MQGGAQKEQSLQTSLDEKEGRPLAFHGSALGVSSDDGGQLSLTSSTKTTGGAEGGELNT